MAAEAVLWKRDEHTKAKHELLLAFFHKWVSIHSGFFASRPGGGLVRIYDGFAGPGVYADGESGSPLILMRALCTNTNLKELRQAGQRPRPDAAETTPSVMRATKTVAKSPHAAHRRGS